MKKKWVTPIPKTPYDHDMSEEFCSMGEADTCFKRAEIGKLFKEMALGVGDNDQHVLVLSGLWHIAMTQPNDPKFPSLGIFKCMANLINKAIKHTRWLLNNQNIYIPYYAAHIIGSYTMKKEELAQLAVQSGVIPPLLELLRGNMSWVEQRVAVRALGHLASFETTFEAVAEYEQEVVKLAMNLASTCLELVYIQFVGVKDVNKRVQYHRNLVSRGIGGLEMENRKAEEWATQLQCWSLHLLNCFACKQRPLSLNLITKMAFLEDVCEMWGGLVNYRSPCGVGLIRILCYTKVGRKRVVESAKVMNALGNLSRSSDNWQYLGIDCLVLLLRDPHTRNRVIDIAASYLIDLIELDKLGEKSKVGETIMKALLLDEHKGLQLQGINLEVKRRNKEKQMCEERLKEARGLASLLKQEGDEMLWLGKVEEGMRKYSEALEVWPLRYRKERMLLYRKRAECHVIVKDPDSAISDATRALSLSKPANSEGRSLWRRAEAYDMKGMSRESLMDCITLMNGSIKLPYHVARMLCKQMDATCIFAAAPSNNRGVSTVVQEEPFAAKQGRKKATRRAIKAGPNVSSFQI